MKKSLLWLALWLPMLLHATVYVPSTVPDPKQQGQEYYVSNPDAIIADSDVVWLNRCAERLNNATRVELSVVALESIGDADVFNFGYELFQRWGIGRHGQNTGHRHRRSANRRALFADHPRGYDPLFPRGRLWRRIVSGSITYL